MAKQFKTLEQDLAEKFTAAVLPHRLTGWGGRARPSGPTYRGAEGSVERYLDELRWGPKEDPQGDVE